MPEKDLGRRLEFGNSLDFGEQQTPYFNHLPEQTTDKSNTEIARITENLANITRPPSKEGNPRKKFDGLLAGRQVWEPFNSEPESAQRFINLYGGNFAQDMKLNRKNTERLIRVAALEGNIILTSLSPSRTRSIDINPDGSTTAKRRLFWDENPDDKENPYHRVTSIPEGWRVEICDQRIRDELAEKFAGEKLQKKFVAKFNQHLRAGLWQVLWKEKLTTRKNPYFAGKVFHSLLYPAIFAGWSLIGGLKLPDLVGVGFVFIAYGIHNCLTYLDDARMRRSLRSFYEYFMPVIEVDRVARARVYLNLKGRNLVRLTSG